jgi:hypothetical protein
MYLYSTYYHRSRLQRRKLTIHRVLARQRDIALPPGIPLQYLYMAKAGDGKSVWGGSVTVDV